MRFKKTIFTMLAILGVALTIMISDAAAGGKQWHGHGDDAKPTPTEVLNGENGGRLSNMSFISDGMVYHYIYSGLSVADVVRLEKDLVKCEAAGFRKMRLFVNSPGGGAFAGLAMSDIIIGAKSRGWYIEAYANGIVASAAVPIFASASHRVATVGTLFMVHEAALWKWPGRETASDIRSQNALMKVLQEQYIGKLVDGSTTSHADWTAMERETTWFSAEKALELGLVDEVK